MTKFSPFVLSCLRMHGSC